MTTEKTGEIPEFQHLPLGSIIVEEQIRSSINITSESFKALMSSIHDKGVLEPVLVTQRDDKYLLLCGERRYLAAQKLGFETIPAMIVNEITEKDEILALQLIENLQREDLNPIDQAKGILAYFLAKHPDSSDGQEGTVYNLDGVMSDLVRYKMKRETLSDKMVSTVDTILKISGKAYTSLFRTLSLLKLVPKVQEAISAGMLPVSQGYLFAANLANPDFFTIFDEIMEKPVTNAKLEKMLTAYKKVKPTSTEPKPIPIKIKVAGLQTTKTYFEKKAGKYTKPDLQVFLDELKALTSFIEQQIEAAPESISENKPVNKPRPMV